MTNDPQPEIKQSASTNPYKVWFGTLAQNVNNPRLNDAEFRQMARNICKHHPDLRKQMNQEILITPESAKK